MKAWGPDRRAGTARRKTGRGWGYRQGWRGERDPQGAGRQGLGAGLLAWYRRNRELDRYRRSALCAVPLAHLSAGVDLWGYGGVSRQSSGAHRASWPFRVLTCSGSHGRRAPAFTHRKREAKLRRAKLLAALKEGSLTCEVPGCGLDFEKRYGPLGFACIEVHHKKPLAARTKKGAKTRLQDLAIVCANCHRMIHKGGECRQAYSLLGLFL